MNPSTPLWAAIAADVAIIFLSIRWAYSTDLIKDAQSKTETTEKPYSFSRTQLLWWVNVIVICFIYLFAKEQAFSLLNNTCLILLGISAGTTVSGRIIDSNKATTAAKNSIVLSQDAKKENFLTDILSDENGISVHRFQGVVFNVVLGIFFMVKFFTDLKLPEFGSQELALLGISSSTYLAGKMSETAS
jgi:hypothetical protein